MKDFDLDELKAKAKFIIPIRSYLQQFCVGVDVKNVFGKKKNKIKFFIYPKIVDWFKSFSYTKPYNIDDKESIEYEKDWIRSIIMNEKAYFLTLDIIDATSLINLKTKDISVIVKQYFLNK